MKNRFCTYCGNVLVENQLICPECGKAVKTKLNDERFFDASIDVKEKEANISNNHGKSKNTQFIYRNNARAKKWMVVVLLLTSVTCLYMLFVLCRNLYYVIVYGERFLSMPRIIHLLISVFGIACFVFCSIFRKNRISLFALSLLTAFSAIAADFFVYFFRTYAFTIILGMLFFTLIIFNVIHIKAMKERVFEQYEKSRS